MAEAGQIWIACLTPSAGSSLAALLDLRLGLDVWERRAGSLVVAAPDSTLTELERRRLARVERWETREQHQERMRDRPDRGRPPATPPGGVTAR